MLKKVQIHVFRRIERQRPPLFLALQRTPDKNSLWQPVTGKVEEGEEFDEAAQRELFEETGLAPSGIFASVGEVRFTKGDQQVVEKIFACEVGKDHVRMSSEHSAYEWLPAEKAREKFYYESNRYGLDLVLEELKKL
jgi:8-oxo-dGTP pyrophosphatase MutT (NUDIX family)